MLLPNEKGDRRVVTQPLRYRGSVFFRGIQDITSVRVLIILARLNIPRVIALQKIHTEQKRVSFNFERHSPYAKMCGYYLTTFPLKVQGLNLNICLAHRFSFCIPQRPKIGSGWEIKSFHLGSRCYRIQILRTTYLTLSRSLALIDLRSYAPP